MTDTLKIIYVSYLFRLKITVPSHSLSQNSDISYRRYTDVVGGNVQPKLPDIAILRLNIMGSVPLRVHLQKVGGTLHMIGVALCVVSFLCDFQRNKISSFIFCFRLLLRCIS